LGWYIKLRELVDKLGELIEVVNKVVGAGGGSR